MIPQTPRHDFLHELHKLLRPATYLEIGVQTGRSLAQALPDTLLVGVDPAPQVSVPLPSNPTVFTMTSDEFFAGPGQPGPGAIVPELAFIDGMHLVEYCLRDFMNVERLARPDGRTVVVFDDVLPYSADIAGRIPLAGDWAGDCWKIIPILDQWRPDLDIIPVNVQPTGALVVLGLAPGNTDLAARYDEAVERYAWEFGAAEAAYGIAHESRKSIGPRLALDLIRKHLNIREARQ